MGRPDYIFGQFRETARCRDAQHGDGVCCAFAPQLVCVLGIFLLKNCRNCARAIFVAFALVRCVSHHQLHVSFTC